MAVSAGIAALGVTTLAASNGPELPSLEDFLPEVSLFAGTPFAINRIIMVRLIATAVILLVFGITAARAKLIPSRWQGAVEWLIEFVGKQIVYPVMGELRGKPYIPMITTIFLSIMVFNLCGVIPGANIAATATVTMPLVFAIWTFCQYFITAAREQGLWSFLKEEMFPPGVPWPVYILLAPIQLLELVIIRPLSLTLRLFANMISGHLLVAICLALTQYYLIESSSIAIKGVGVLWFLGGFALTGFEMFVACLQAFIFAILTTVYINSSFPAAE